MAQLIVNLLGVSLNGPHALGMVHLHWSFFLMVQGLVVVAIFLNVDVSFQTSDYIYCYLTTSLI